MTASNINRLSTAFRERRVALGLELEELAGSLGISPETLKSIEDCDWSDIPSGQEYPLVIKIANRLVIDLKNYPVGKSSFLDGYAREDTHPNDLRRERIVMVVMTTAVLAVLAWLLVPVKGLGQSSDESSQAPSMDRVLWQKPISDQPYPVLGEVFPESPITEDGVLVSLKATDACTAQIITENKNEQTQDLRMSEPWTLRIKGSFVLILENAGVVEVEVAGNIIPHGVGVGQRWSGTFDTQGNWLRPLPRIVPPKTDNPDDDDDAVAEPT